MGLAKDLFSKLFGVNENPKVDIEPDSLSEIGISYGDGPGNDELYFLKNTVGYFRMAGNQKNAELFSKLYIKDNKTRKWTQFRDEVELIIPNYDLDLLADEYDIFYKMAMSYSHWQQIQKDKHTLNYLRYSSTEGPTVCKICKKLNNIVLPVDDPFWDIYNPPNHFGCECLLEQLDEDSVKHITDLTKKNLLMPDDLFALNVGKHKLRKLYSE